MIAKGGRLGRLVAPERLSRRRLDPPEKRGTISGFSRASRRRMFVLLNSLNRAVEGLPLLVTLTYPGADRWNRVDRQLFKRHLDSFWKRFERAYPQAHGIWKLEPQKRGAPHYHLLIFGVDFVPIAVVSRMWWEVVGSGELDNLKNGVDVRQAKSWPAVGSYVSKYVAKPVDWIPMNWTTPGRWWGLLGRDRFTIELNPIRLSSTGARRIRRLMARMMFRNDRDRQLDFLARPDTGISVFHDEATWRRIVDWAEHPRWKCGLLRPGDTASYRLQLDRRRSREVRKYRDKRDAQTSQR